MTRGTRIRLIAFVVLSAVGLVYLGGSYLGIVDRVLGRGYSVEVLLPSSGGLFEGSEVTYRGVKVGEVDRMTVESGGLRLEVRLQEDARIPADSPVYVHNLSAVGEQYLDFEPASSEGPMLADGDTVRGTEGSLPLGEDVLITDLNRLVGSLDEKALGTVVDELGAMFRGNAEPLRSLVDDAQILIDAARENEDATLSLLRSGQTVLQTQADQSGNIRSFARDLSLLLDTLVESDDDLRTVLEDADPAAREATALVARLSDELPPALEDLLAVTDIVNGRLPALEQLLVTFPRLVAAGPTALAEIGGDKLGRVNLNLNFQPEACTEGYLPPGQWRPTREEGFVPFFDEETGEPRVDVECASGPPVNMRGMKYAPEPIDWRRELLGDDR